MTNEEAAKQALDAPHPTPKEVEVAEGVARMTELSHQLGFSESAQMHELRAPLIEAMAGGDHTKIKELLNRYQGAGESIVEQLEGEAYTKGQIGLIIATGLLWQAAGHDNSYAGELYNAHQYARNMHFDEEAQAIQAARKTVLEAAEKSLNSEYVGPPTEEIVAVCKREFPPELHEELDYLLTLPPGEVLEEVASLMLGSDLGWEPLEFFADQGWIEGNV